MQVSIVFVALLHWSIVLVGVCARKCGCGHLNILFLTAVSTHVIAPIVVTPIVIVVVIGTDYVVIIITPAPFFIVCFVRGAIKWINPKVLVNNKKTMNEISIFSSTNNETTKTSRNGNIDSHLLVFG